MWQTIVEFFVTIIGLVAVTFVALFIVVIVAAVLTGLYIAVVRAIKKG